MFFFNFDKQPLNLIGVKVVHTGKCKLLSYGEGTIVGQEDKIITVQFKHSIKKFEFPKAFTLSLKAVDEKIHYEILTSMYQSTSTLPATEDTKKTSKAVDITVSAPTVIEPKKANINPELAKLFDKLRELEKHFLDKYQVDDIYSNSKIYEILIANHFDHKLIPGHSGSRDAKDEQGNEIEYKHYKESSSNHTWTFNDFSDETIEKLRSCAYVYFVYVDDVSQDFPGQIKWAYITEGVQIANYLAEATKRITNARKMINVSCRQLESIGYRKTYYENFDLTEGSYGEDLVEIISTITQIEELTGVTGLLTSNKLWELLIGLELNHTVNSEQGGRAGAHDASDADGHLYEYKVSKAYSWNFQDISENVLNKYYDDYRIILAVVDKTALKIKDIYSAEPIYVVPLLKQKLQQKQEKRAQNNKEVRRLQVSLSKSDLRKINAEKIY